jgi:hypothetical protein
MLSLNEIFLKDINAEKESLKRIVYTKIDDIQFKSDINFLWYYNQTFALHNLINGNTQVAKEHFYTCGRIDEYLINKFDSRRLDAGILNITYALLSDNLSLLNRYATLSHTKYQWMVEHGNSTLIYVIQQSLVNNWEKVKLGLDIMKEKNMKLFKIIQPDIAFFEGILIKDENKMTEAILQLLNDHKKRNRLMTLSQDHISVPALTYLKLAWLKGIKLEIDHPLIPKELLPYKPLDKYKDRYEFLKS